MLRKRKSANRKKSTNKSTNWLKWLIILIIAMIFAGVFWLTGGFNFAYNYFSSDVDSTTTHILNEGGDADTLSVCTIVISKDIACVGDTVNMNIQDGANTLCSLYYNYNKTGWKLYGSALTSSSGSITVTDSPQYTGIYGFRAICGDCVTNLAEIEVISCGGSDGGDSSDGNSDGSPFDPINMPCAQVFTPLDASYCTGHPCYEGGTCIFVSGGIVMPNRCECQPEPESCAESCQQKGYFAGYCTDIISKVPCGTDYMNADGNSFCSSGFSLGTCCCDT